MKRITLYDEELDDINAEHFRPLLGSAPSTYITKRELQEYQDLLRIQKEEYERRNKTLLSEEIKKAWWN